jgi:hypothetical protein
VKQWALKRVKQCAKCPWRIDTDPRKIPNGYTHEKHKNLQKTISKDPLRELASNELRAMACHEEHDAHCIGWLKHQIGAGNNIVLRIQMSACTNAGEIQLVGEQHKTFENTLPRISRTD